MSIDDIFVIKHRWFVVRNTAAFIGETSKGTYCLDDDNVLASCTVLDHDITFPGKWTHILKEKTNKTRTVMGNIDTVVDFGELFLF